LLKDIIGGGSDKSTPINAHEWDWLSIADIVVENKAKNVLLKLLWVGLRLFN